MNPKEFKSYWDLVTPKWKGKYVSQDPTSTGLGGGLQFMYYHPELGPEFIKRLFGDMQPTLGRDRRQITDWLAQGKFALCVGCRDTNRAKSQGLPVDELDNVDWKEGLELTSGGGSMSLIKGGPNPNAARVFINWFLSRRGQLAMQKYNDLYGEDAPNSRRMDIAKDMLVPTQPHDAGKKIFRCLRSQVRRHDADVQCYKRDYEGAGGEVEVIAIGIEKVGCGDRRNRIVFLIRSMPSSVHRDICLDPFSAA